MKNPLGAAPLAVITITFSPDSSVLDTASHTIGNNVPPVMSLI